MECSNVALFPQKLVLVAVIRSVAWEFLAVRKTGGMTIFWLNVLRGLEAIASLVSKAMFAVLAVSGAALAILLAVTLVVIFWAATG